MSGFWSDVFSSGKVLIIGAIAIVAIVFPWNQVFTFIHIDFLENKSLLDYLLLHTSFWLSIFPFLLLIVIIITLIRQYRR